MEKTLYLLTITAVKLPVTDQPGATGFDSGKSLSVSTPSIVRKSRKSERSNYKWQ